MLRLCDELWLCGDRISPGMAGEKEMAERLAGIPVRSVSTEENGVHGALAYGGDGDVHGMNLTMGSLFDGIGGFPPRGGAVWDQNSLGQRDRAVPP